MGLDLSVAGTGLIVFQADETVVFGKVLRKELVRTKPLDRPTRDPGLAPNGIFYGNDMQRIDFIASRVMVAWRIHQPEIVGIEEYAFGAKGRGLSILHELGGVVKWRFFRKEALVLPVSPTELKKWVTGSGSADKQRMMDAADGFAYPFDHGGDDNIADAFHVARWAAWRLHEESPA